MRGMLSQHAQGQDQFFTEEVNCNLYYTTIICINTGIYRRNYEKCIQVENIQSLYRRNAPINNIYGSIINEGIFGISFRSVNFYLEFQTKQWVSTWCP